MSTTIIVAIVAFVSTILGASIVAVTNYILAVRRERADTCVCRLPGLRRQSNGFATIVKLDSLLVRKQIC
jgi:hypothetical protein